MTKYSISNLGISSPQEPGIFIQCRDKCYGLEYADTR